MSDTSPSFRGISVTVDLFQIPLEIDSEEIVKYLVVKVKTSYAVEKGKSRSRKWKRKAFPEFEQP